MLQASKIFLIWLLLALAGCAGIRKTFAEKPQAKLKEVKITKIGLSEVDLAAVVEVYNPNRFALNLVDLNYQIQALGLVIGEGSYSEGFRVPGKETRSLTLPLKIRSRTALELAKQFLTQANDVTAIVKGAIKFTTPIGPWELQFEDAKKITNPLSS